MLQFIFIVKLAGVPGVAPRLLNNARTKRRFLALISTKTIFHPFFMLGVSSSTQYFFLTNSRHVVAKFPFNSIIGRGKCGRDSKVAKELSRGPWGYNLTIIPSRYSPKSDANLTTSLNLHREHTYRHTSIFNY